MNVPRVTKIEKQPIKIWLLVCPETQEVWGPDGWVNTKDVQNRTLDIMIYQNITDAYIEAELLRASGKQVDIMEYRREK